ncbi:MBL fold metallo-hydrolase [Amycolatopsis endophytica]|uniref:Glyoxylase-like metal-dependent hydrolase (Beta-lactamase superfamily II) n=1 Tax=Amycolatopsis endophytica TaxID=860233 RepID=A0A853AW00_9PSEU|nr:MBL fold metallo-hydrolase [Amycolatopsis endophytica]NYI86804.1 glyoxylase-like metal-dependent hydrolase (beta-lactamase superfamily II) [Amycolatopsis endophytica]
MTWFDLADGVHARRYEHLDQTLGLVVGSERCLVIDTGGDEVQGTQFAAEVREITNLPWTVVITHAHFDHHFGTAAFLPCPVWAHQRCRDALVREGETDRETWVRRFAGKPEADRLASARLVLPDHLLTDRVQLDLGARTVELIHPGLAHTDHDVAVHVPDADIMFAGDLVEQGAPPSIGPDAHPRDWPGALDRLLALRAGTIVPGHGDPVDRAFVAAQRDGLSRR